HRRAAGRPGRRLRRGRDRRCSWHSPRGRRRARRGEAGHDPGGDRGADRRVQRSPGPHRLSITVAEPAIPRKRRRRRRLRIVSVLRLAFLLAIYGASFGAAALYLAIQTINEELPKDLAQLLDYAPNRKSVVLSSDGEEIGAFSIENRRIVALDRMPPHVPAAFLSAEDRRFYRHKGFDLMGIARAAVTNFRSDGNIK